MARRRLSSFHFRKQHPARMNPRVVLLVTCCSCKHNLHASSHEFIAHSPSVHLPSHIHSILVTLTGLEVPSISGPGCLISDTRRSFHQLRHVTDWCFFFFFFLLFLGNGSPTIRENDDDSCPQEQFGQSVVVMVMV